MKKIQYKEINLEPAGKKLFDSYADKAFSVTFVYSNRGNFLIRGFWGETRYFLAELVKQGFKFYYQYSFYNGGAARFTHTKFYTDRVWIFEPAKRTSLRGEHRNKFEFYKRVNNENKKVLALKRLPKRWIPEFDTL